MDQIQSLLNTIQEGFLSHSIDKKKLLELSSRLESVLNEITQSTSHSTPISTLENQVLELKSESNELSSTLKEYQSKCIQLLEILNVLSMEQESS